MSIQQFIEQSIKNLPSLKSEQIQRQLRYFHGQFRHEESEDYFGITYSDLVELLEHDQYISALRNAIEQRKLNEVTNGGHDS